MPLKIGRSAVVSTQRKRHNLYIAGITCGHWLDAFNGISSEESIQSTPGQDTGLESLKSGRMLDPCGVGEISPSSAAPPFAVASLHHMHGAYVGRQARIYSNIRGRKSYVLADSWASLPVLKSKCCDTIRDSKGSLTQADLSSDAMLVNHVLGRRLASKASIIIQA